MKLSRLRIEQLRKFRQPVEIGELADGINLFVGPNEAGKSTIAAAIRAAFFERHRSASVEPLRPWGDSAASPSIEIDFTLDGRALRLRKRFLNQKRCELEIDGRQLDGTDAEDRLAELLGFGFAGRGESNAKHWGIPGLLWIEQGQAQEIGEPVANAAEHLNRALGTALGAVVGGAGDAVLQRVSAERNALLTAARGEPKGDYAQALERVDALKQEIDRIDALVASYRIKVDQLAALRVEHGREAAEQPWAALRERERKAVQELETVRSIQRELRTVCETAQQLAKQQGLLRSGLDGFTQEDRDCAARAEACGAARLALQSAQAVVASCHARHERAQAAAEAAAKALLLARQEDQRHGISARIGEQRAQIAAVEATRIKAEAEHAALLVARRDTVETELRDEDLEALRQQFHRLRELEIRQAAVATRLRYDLEPGCSVRIGESECRGAGETLVVAPTRVQLPGIGRIEVVPGGSDLAQLRSELQILRERHAETLRARGVATWEEAEARHRKYRDHLAECKMREATVRALAPQGIEALRETLSQSDARLRQEEAVLAAFPPPSDVGMGILPIAQAESAAKLVNAERDAVAAQVQQARLEAANAQAARDAAEREYQAVQLRLGAPDRAARLRKTQDELLDVNAESAAIERKIDDLQKTIDAARPELLKQDADRFRASAEASEKARDERRLRIVGLESELATLGAQGLDERRADLLREHEQAGRQATALQRRAVALDRLLNLLNTKRAAYTRRLRAPLQRHLDRYVQMLFPQAALELGDDFAPRLLTRPDADAGEFDQLSFGAREQMGVISRLAYADLLKDAGRPTLIMLDDALVHSDAERMAQMKRVLFDAATRHQILVFSCHPENWRDLGVRARSVEELRNGAG